MGKLSRREEYGKKHHEEDAKGSSSKRHAEVNHGKDVKENATQSICGKYRFNPKEEQWILDNDKDDHYYNNSALKNAWSSLSYPIYDGDYYFAFIHDKPRVNAQYNAKANRELRKYITSFLNADEIYDKMQKYFSMQFKDAGSGDTMTREELWTAIVDMRQKNPVKEELEEIALEVS